VGENSHVKDMEPAEWKAHVKKGTLRVKNNNPHR